MVLSNLCITINANSIIISGTEVNLNLSYSRLESSLAFVLYVKSVSKYY